MSGEGLRALQEALVKWVRLERKPETPEVETKDVGGVQVTTVMAFPEAKEGERHADLHFMLASKDESFPTKEELIATVQAAIGEGEFVTMEAQRLAGGLSYIDLGGWLGSQDLAVRLIGAMELAEIGPAITPATLGITGTQANELAGMGVVMMTPYDGWTPAEVKA